MRKKLLLKEWPVLPMMRECILSNEESQTWGSLLETGAALPEKIQNMSCACATAIFSATIPFLVDPPLPDHTALVGLRVHAA